VMWSRKLMWAERFRKDERWLDWRKPMVLQSFALKNKVILIVGLGAIGKVLAKKASGMGMVVHAMKRQLNPEDSFPFVAKMWNMEDFKKALGLADFVVPLVPIAVDTIGMFSSEEFRSMKPTALFINTSRGKVVDEDALIQALRERQIAGAALDVFQKEPLPEDSPLWEMENVILTPHIGGNYPEYTMDVYEQFIPNLERYVRGDPLMNEANKELGY
jgi:phosphoglycerate dehydrogenase-like enzyme